MKRIVTLALSLAACSGRFQPPPAVPNVPLPSGNALRPWDPAQPGLARPLGIARLNGKAYVALGNYDETFTPRGPGLLASFVPSDGRVALIDLGGAQDRECISAGWVRTVDGLLYVTCSGDFNTGAGTAVLEVDPGGEGKVTKRFAAPVSPAAVAITRDRVWFGSALTGEVYALDRSTFALALGPIAVACPAGTYQTINDVAIVQGDLYAICSNSTGGLLNRMDPSTGAAKTTAEVGPIAAAMTETSDGRIAIVSGADNRLRLVTIAGDELRVEQAYKFSDPTSTLQDVRALDRFVFTAASGSNTVQKIDLSAKSGPALVDEQSTGTCDAHGVCPGPWNILPLDDGQALVTNQGSSTLVAVTWAH